MQNKDRFWKVEAGINAFFTKGILCFLFFIFYSLNTQAQCAMCRATLESEGSSTKAEAINDGIVYLMIIPYVLVAIVGVIVYRMYTKKRQ